MKKQRTVFDIIIFIMPFVLFFSIIFYSRFFVNNKSVVDVLENEYKYEISDQNALLKVAVLYSGDENVCRDSLSHLNLASFASMKVSAIELERVESLSDISKYDIIYPDKTVLQQDRENFLNELFNEYVYNGGNLFVTNEFVSVLDKQLLGIESYEKLEKIPDDFENVADGTDLQSIGEIVCDFSLLYREYYNYDVLKEFDYGYSVKVDTAIPVVKSGETVLYTLNNYGSGTVFLTNPILPNVFGTNVLEGNFKNDNLQPFASTTMTANSIIKSSFASYVSKMKYGFSVEKMYGSFGSKPISWQLHYEEITGIENDSAIIFSELCKKYNQIPSFTLIRNTYKWFTRYESVSYLELNGEECTMDYYNGAYSNGTHVVADNKPFYIDCIENAGSYFVDYPQYTQRAYPCFEDVDGDGITDMVCGSNDGYFYFAKGVKKEGVLCFEKVAKLNDVNNKPMSVAGYSSPEVCDYDNDGVLDIISGSSNGEILLFCGIENSLNFKLPQVIATVSGTTTMPVFDDVDADGIKEIVFGTLNGEIYTFKDNSVNLLLELENETFVSPEVYDIDSDGDMDIIVGTYDGYFKIFRNTNNTFTDSSYILCNEMNYKGNQNVKFGNNSVPRFADLGFDGKNELVAGCLEYGLNVPIDSDLFEFKEQLHKQIDYIKENGFYLGTHFYTNEFASTKREETELKFHKDAFNKYGINIENLGANQHTWYVSTFSREQSFENLKYAGVLWNSGYQSPESSAVPQSSTENVLSLPFFTDENKDFLVLNTGTLLYLDDEYADITAKYYLPLEVYYHCDFAYENTRKSENDIKHVDDFVRRNGYYFVREDQLVKSVAASENMFVEVKKTEKGFELESKPLTKGFPLYDEDFASSTGVRIEFSLGTDMNNVSVISDVVSVDGTDVYTSLNKQACISFDKTDVRKTNIIGLNTPAKIETDENTTKITFSGYGLLIAELDKNVVLNSKDWNVETKENSLLVSKFSSEDNSVLEFASPLSD